MNVIVMDDMQRRLLSNSAKLLSLRKHPEASRTKACADLMISNLSSINIQADEHGDTLLSVSSLLIQEVVDAIYNSSGVPEQVLIDKAITWHEQARRYIKQPTDEKVIVSLISKFPADVQKELASHIPGAVVSTETAEELKQTPDFDENEFSLNDSFSDQLEDLSFLDAPDPWAEDSNLSFLDAPDPWAEDSNLDFLDGGVDETLVEAEGSVSQIIGREFTEILVCTRELINNLNNSIDVPEKDIVSLSQIIKTLKEASTEAKCEGLVILFDFISRNIDRLSEKPLVEQKQVMTLLSVLPEALNNHLNEPMSDDSCLTLMELLAAPEWALALKYREEKRLLYGLINQNSLTEGRGHPVVEEGDLTADQVSLIMSEDATPSFIDSFFSESGQHAEGLASSISKISRGVDTEAHIRTAQRLSHTLKGSANLLGVKGIANLAHYLEDILEYLVDHAEVPSPELSNCMQEAADTIEVMIECLAIGEKEPENSLSSLRGIVQWINRLHSGLEPVITVEENQTPSDDSVAPVFIRQLNEDGPDERRSETNLDEQEGVEAQSEVISEAEDSEPKEVTDGQVEQAMPSEILRVPRSLIDNILNMVGETSISLGQMQEKLLSLSRHGQSIHGQDKVLQSKRFELEELINIQGLSSQNSLKRVAGSKLTDSQFDSLEMDEYNEFYGAAHSYIETVSDARMVSRKVTQEVDELETLFLQQQRLNKALQGMVMGTRMVSVSSISARLHRTVRQASRMTEKDAELTIIGENLQIDGDLLNNLVDPLMHLLRNSVDHGIESKDVRFDKGKPPIGQVTLKFWQEGSHLVVKCFDDGSGLDYSSITTKAKEKGLPVASDMSNEAIARLILAPGFSTRESATQVSGRGVGMDVVNTAVVHMKGSIAISDSSNSGVVFEIRLPVTLLTNHSILVACGEQNFAIPTNTLEQILTPGAGQLELIGNQLSYNLEDSVYPAISLTALLGSGESGFDDEEDFSQKPVLFIEVDNQVHAILIDSISSAVDLVIKGFGPFVGDIPGVLGISLLGNGDIISVVDLPYLVRKHTKSDDLFLQKDSGITAIPNADSQQTSIDRIARVLIVDDSLSARDNLAELARDAGYKPILARDGLEALNLLNESPPDLVLTDLEMPRMNGLELSSQVRSGGACPNVPIVMITSRSMQKHRKEASIAGVDEYITKPYIPEDLMLIVRNRLSGVC